MIYGLLIAFVPLFIGYLFKVRSSRIMNIVNKLMMYSLYLILLAMGVVLGQLDDLGEILPKIGVIALGLSVIFHLCNIGSLIIFDKFYPMKRASFSAQVISSRWQQIGESLLLLGMVLIGGVIGFLSKTFITFPSNMSTYALVVMIFCVGVQLRNSGIPLREVFFNKRGLFTSVIFMLSGLFGGVIAAYILNLPMAHALALASGFGWYSLSSVLLNDAWGPFYGSIAFFNDLSREIFCLFSIPFFMRLFPSTAVGLGGATSLDCMLPVIQKSGGMQVVPLAISFGFIVNLVAPLLLAFFIGLA
ncbi:lysine exporter LysO family protein [Otariodibacter oris]|uniref:Uncharacterized membrane protein YbjE (DUF340 family) n=1 Tax=Otariodibacter oris TaxID=1032623 RepID=A0A420XFW7_9PAST|nr:lysine exporter LysO family protein [Otariodibacter oris]QGM80330.1 hypothetical protein A6A10_02410 [Otariodibacter oris]RKR71698.1 uncharacterized membrane protein YbjE (DUF340 family) [Otariodibacter oris]